MKEALGSSSVLVHHDAKRPLIYHVNALFEHGMSCIVSQVQDDNITFEAIKEGLYDRKLERPLLFLSCELSAAEKNYWATELETQALV